MVPNCFLNFHPTLDTIQLKICINLYGYEIVPHCGFRLHFSAYSGVEHLLKCVVIKAYSFYEWFAL